MWSHKGGCGGRWLGASTYHLLSLVLPTPSDSIMSGKEGAELGRREGGGDGERGREEGGELGRREGGGDGERGREEGGELGRREGGGR